MTTEKRCIDFEQSRMKIEGDGAEKWLTGYAAIEYRKDHPGTEFRMGNRVVERVKRSAISSILARKGDIIGSFNHSPDTILGRRSSGTMRLSEDEIGLKYGILLPDTSYARDLEVLVRRGDVSGSSFMGKMKVNRQVEGDVVVRWVEEIDAFELGPVAAPAYEATTAQMRSLGDSIEAEIREELRNQALAMDAKILDLTLLCR